MKKFHIMLFISCLSTIACATSSPSTTRPNNDIYHVDKQATHQDTITDETGFIPDAKDTQQVKDAKKTNDSGKPEIQNKDILDINDGTDIQTDIASGAAQDIRNDTNTKPRIYTISINKGEAATLKLSQGASLERPVKGMGIFPDGTFTWTPTNDQGGEYKIKVIKDQNIIAELDINVGGPDIKYDGVFVDYTAESSGDGTPESPFNSISKACQYLMKNNLAKTNIYFRGGIYKNPDFSNGLDNRGLELIKGCKGTPGHPVRIKPWGNEHTKFISDGNDVFSFRYSSFLIIEGMEFQGIAKNITFDGALDHWWISRNYYKGSAITFNKSCHDIVLQDNVIHDFPGACVAVHGCDAFNITHNIVYDCAWWTISGTGGIVVTQSTNLSKASTTLHANLIFDVESRIFSRVFSKGFAHLVIDEGEATLYQQGTDLSNTKPDYDKFEYVNGNFLAYNGKGITINRADKAIINNNSMFFSKALRVGSNSSNITIKNNVVQVDKDDAWVSISRTNVSNLIAAHNYFNKGAKARYTSNPSIVLSNNTELDQVFSDPGNFRVAGSIAQAGASVKDWAIIKDVLKKFNITIKPDETWKATPEEKTIQTKRIIESAKDLGPDVTINCKYMSDKTNPRVIIQNLPENFVKQNHLPSPDFTLLLRYPYDGEKCDIR